MQPKNATSIALPVARESKAICHTSRLSTLDYGPWKAKAENQDLCAVLLCSQKSHWGLRMSDNLPPGQFAQDNSSPIFGLGSG